MEREEVHAAGQRRCGRGAWDFGAFDLLTPHPVYGWMGWAAVLNPSREMWQRCVPLIADAHERAKATFARRVRKDGV